MLQGNFADMYEFIDSDSELSREDFLPNLLKASETDSKLYTFSDRFKVFTVLGKLPYSAIKWASPPSSSETLPHRDPRARRSSPAPAKTISLTTPFICQAAGLLILKKAHAILPPTILSGCWNMQ